MRSKGKIIVFYFTGYFLIWPIFIFSEEKSGFELPEVTIMGKDVSEFETPGLSSVRSFGGQKGSIQYLEHPMGYSEEERSSLRTVSSTLGRYGTFTSGVDWTGKDKNIDYLMQFKYARTDGYRDHGSEDLIRPSGSVGIQAKDYARFTGEYSYFRKRMELPGRIEQPSNIATRENESVDFEVGLELYPLEGQRLMGHFFGTVSRTDEDPLEESFDNRFLGFSTEFTNSMMKGGVEFWAERLQNFYSYQKVSGFLGLTGWEIYDNWILELIAQTDYYEGFFVRFDPRASLTWYLSDRFSIKIASRRDMEVRSWSESYLSEYYVEGNLEEIRPQRDLEEEISFSYEMSENWNLTFLLFRRETKDMFIWQDLDENGLYTLGNHPDALLQGGTLALHTQFTDTLSGTAKVTLQELDGKEAGFTQIPYYPKAKLDWGILWESKFGLGLGTNISYVGRQFIDVEGTGKISDYVLWDTMTSYRWKNAKFFMKVLNVLDQRYDFFAGYPGPDTQYQFGVNVEF